MRAIDRGVSRAGVATLLVLAGSARAQVCGPAWSPGLETDGVDFDAHSIVTLDPDGAGPLPTMVYAAGEFKGAGGVSANCVASWDGRRWQALGSGFNIRATSLAVFDEDGDGPNPPRLFAGGLFTTADGQAIRMLARWDGSAWSQVGAGLGTSGSVSAMVVWDDDGAGPDPPALYVCGSFTTAAGGPGNRIAKWDGTAWSALGAGLPATANAMAVHDEDGPGPGLPALYVGGGFTVSGGGPGNRVAKWNGSAWSAVGGGFNYAGGATIQAMLSFDADGPGPALPRLYASGTFDHITISSLANNIAQWDGTNWTAVGQGVSSEANSLDLWDADGAGPGLPKLLIGGNFSSANGDSTISSLALYDGAAYSAFPGGVHGGIEAVRAADVDGDGQPELYVSGYFFGTGRGNNEWGRGSRAARWEGGSWSPMGGGLGVDYSPLAFLMFDDDGPGPLPPALYAAGAFFFAGDVYSRAVARFDGSQWSAVTLDVGAPNGVLVPDLGGVTGAVLYDEDGSGPGRASLFCGGYFLRADGTQGAGLLRFDGSAWTMVGTGVLGSVYSLAVWDPDGPGPQREALYVGGFGLRVNGAATGVPVVKWDGTAWSTATAAPLQSTDSVYAMTVCDLDGTGPQLPRLFAGGSLAGATKRVVYNTGAGWFSIGADLPTCTGTGCTPVRCLFGYDEDGAGPGTPKLYAGGDFFLSGGLSYLARWDGVAWASVPGVAPSGSVYALASFDADGAGGGGDQLYIGGGFVNVNGAPFNGLARWDGSGVYPMDGGVRGFVSRAYVLTPVDEDGAGPKPAGLWIGGEFRTAGGIGAGNIARWGMSTPVAITQQPAPVTVAAGSTAEFSARGDGSWPLVYRWQRAGVDLENGSQASGSVVSGASGPTLRIAGAQAADAGGYSCVVSNACGPVSTGAAALTVGGAACYPNCDSSTVPPVLNVLDFTCFLTRFASGDQYANCDHSTQPPVLNVLDFTCFLQRFSSGCP